MAVISCKKIKLLRHVLLSRGLGTSIFPQDCVVFWDMTICSQYRATNILEELEIVGNHLPEYMAYDPGDHSFINIHYLENLIAHHSQLYTE
jgi:hypothetical protein